MKRPNSSDSLGALMSICPNSTDEHHVNNQENNTTMYTRDHHFEFNHHQNQTHGIDGLLDEEGCVEESAGLGHVSEKKRRLSNEQVKALEKNFEVENKLEPERKVKLAQELGLQPRQVAVWFQNRRARWKTKNLERDYGDLKANYDALKLEFETLQRDNESLLKEIQELKPKLNGDGSNKSSSDSQVSVKEEPIVSETEDDEDEKGKLEEVEAAHVNNYLAKSDDQPAMEINFGENSNELNTNPFVLYDSKDGSSDSDSSAILNNEDNNNNYYYNYYNYINSPILDDHNKFLEIHRNNGSSSSSSMNLISFRYSNSDASDRTNSTLEESKRAYQPQFVKIEELDFFNEEESCTTATFFSDEQAPTLNWYNPDEWNH